MIGHTRRPRYGAPSHTGRRCVRQRNARRASEARVALLSWRGARGRQQQRRGPASSSRDSATAESGREGPAAATTTNAARRNLNYARRRRAREERAPHAGRPFMANLGWPCGSSKAVRGAAWPHRAKQFVRGRSRTPMSTELCSLFATAFARRVHAACAPVTQATHRPTCGKGRESRSTHHPSARVYRPRKTRPRQALERGGGVFVFSVTLPSVRKGSAERAFFEPAGREQKRGQLEADKNICPLLLLPCALRCGIEGCAAQYADEVTAYGRAFLRLNKEEETAPKANSVEHRS